MANEYGFNEIRCRQLKDNPFQLVGHDWFLMTAEKDGVANTMTVAWGGLGLMWGKNVVFIAVRPERYTYEFVEAAPTFSLTAFHEDYRKMMAYCGTVSGRDEDKIAKSGLTLVHDGETPYFAESRLCFICRKIMGSVFQPGDFVDAEYNKFYGGENTRDGLGGGYHTLYIAKIEKVLIKEGEAFLPPPK
ncbi:flavin reductase [Desulfococcaceae bacterium OttesenSCG-928-F15]|nr:flavin reductase [Desulfococcaceae bacterium OttesenSCG-928-F15]